MVSNKASDLYLHNRDEINKNLNVSDLNKTLLNEVNKEESSDGDNNETENFLNEYIDRLDSKGKHMTIRRVHEEHE